MNPLRVLLVDDEPLAREGLRLRLVQMPGVEVVGECGNARAAAAALESLAPDLLLLDIQMPGRSGFELLASVPAKSRPAVIFVTAYDRYAVRAFDVHALDYLLKPVETERLRDAVERARQRLASRELQRLGESLKTLLGALGGAEREAPDAEAVDSGALPPIPTLGTGALAGRFVVREGRRVYAVAAADVEWIESWGDYVYLHAGGRSHLVRERMKTLADGLDAARFVRIHRGAIVNLHWVSELRTREHGEYDVVLKDGRRLRLGRRYHDAVPRLLARLPGRQEEVATQNRP